MIPKGWLGTPAATKLLDRLTPEHRPWADLSDEERAAIKARNDEIVTRYLRTWPERVTKDEA